jgi:hypothetical protein
MLSEIIAISSITLMQNSKKLVTSTLVLIIPPLFGKYYDYTLVGVCGEKLVSQILLLLLNTGYCV